MITYYIVSGGVRSTHIPYKAKDIKHLRYRICNDDKIDQRINELIILGERIFVLDTEYELVGILRYENSQMYWITKTGSVYKVSNKDGSLGKRM